jgi:LAS seventeen-binding protein 1/2
MPRSPDSTALVGHILSQTKHNLEFLASQDIISRAECREILARLPTNTDDLALSQRAVRLSIDDAPTSRPVPPPKAIARAKALWAYNEDGNASIHGLQSCSLY